MAQIRRVWWLSGGARRGVNLRALRWLTIILPVGFLIAADVIRRAVVPDPARTVVGAGVVYVVAGVAVTAFSYLVFRMIASSERIRVEQNRQLSALNELAVAATENLRLDDILATGLDHALTAMQADAGMICLVDPERDEHSVLCVRGLPDELAREVQRAKLSDDPIAVEVVTTGRPVIIERVMNDRRVAEAAARLGIESLISAPLQAAGEVNGILVVASHTRRSFSLPEQEFIDGIGGQLGIVIRNASLYEQSLQQNRDLNALLRVGEAVSSSLDFDEVLQRSLDTITGVVSVDGAEIWLLEGDELQMRCHRGDHAEAFLERVSFGVGEGLIGVVAATGKPLVTHELPLDARFRRQAVVRAGFRTFAALPVRFRGAPIGVLAVAAFSSEAVSEANDLRLLAAIGEQIAPAVENARLHREVEDTAILRERERISREMHDGLAQVLGYVNTQVLAVRKLLKDRRLDVATEELVKLEEAARSTYSDVREGILGLRTAPGRNDDLAGALRNYVDGYRHMSGIDTHLNVSPDAAAAPLSTTAEIQLIRIVQEALTNVRKHSGATEALVSLDCDDRGLRVVVADSGRGFDPTSIGSGPRPRFGLQTMRERTEAVGGDFSIETVVGGGTRVVLQIPTEPSSVRAS